MPTTLDPQHDALGVIDVQPAFMPGGSLPTPDGMAVVDPINRLLRSAFAMRFATQDWHSVGNVTFASSHAGRKPMDRIETGHGSLTLWPDHALRGTREADLHPDLDASMLDCIIRKGTERFSAGYSAFGDSPRAVGTGLGPMLRDRDVRRIFLAGLALDVCVAATARDAVREGFDVFIVEDACRISRPEALSPLVAELDHKGVRFLQEIDLVAPPQGGS